VAIGSRNKASGDGAVAIGKDNKASGNGSFSTGEQNSSGANYSNTMGYGSSTTAAYTTAIGRGATATSIDAVSIGYNTTASGSSSFAIGYRTTAQSFMSMAIGRWNTLSGSTTLWNGNDPLFMAGNGDSESVRNNALILQKDGDLWVAGLYSNGSDKRLKEKIEPINDVLSKVLSIKPIYFEYINKNSFPLGRHIGFIAQEIQPLFPEIINEDPNGFLSLDYSKMTPILLQAIKEQQEIIESQNKKNIELELQIQQILERLSLIEKSK
jgi:hypothetical protein